MKPSPHSKHHPERLSEMQVFCVSAILNCVILELALLLSNFIQYYSHAPQPNPLLAICWILLLPANVPVLIAMMLDPEA